MKKLTLKTFGWGFMTLCIVGVLVLVGYYISTNEVAEPASAPIISSDEVADGIKALIEADEAEQDTLPSQAANATATLDSVRDNGNEFAVAARSFNAVTNSFEVEILATLGDPQPNNEYTVSLTNGNNTIALASLVKEVENTYTLNFQTKENIADYNQIFIIETGSSTQNALQGSFE